MANGPLAPGSLARLDEIAARYALRIIEVIAAERPVPVLVPPIRAVSAEVVPAAPPVAVAAPIVGAPIVAAPVVPEPIVVAPPVVAAVPEVTVVPPRAPTAPVVAVAEPAPPAVPVVADQQLALELDLEPDPETGPRIIVGPVRSGVILHHPGHVFVLGDVNPGAEVRAEGNIVVLGRLRGTAHAGVGKSAGFILALRLEPQQIRICRQVARSGEGDKAGAEPEIAYLSNGGIVVERYQGRLPGNLATSI